MNEATRPRLEDFRRGPLLFYADLLGVSQLSLDMGGQLEALNNILSVYALAKRSYKAHRSPSWQLYLFSDSILVTGFTASRDLPGLIRFADELFSGAVGLHVLLRGAFAYGEFWDVTDHLLRDNDPDIHIGAVVGRGFVKAVSMEKHLKGMRISVDDAFTLHSFPDRALQAPPDLKPHDKQDYRSLVRGEYRWWRDSEAASLSAMEGFLRQADGDIASVNACMTGDWRDKVRNVDLASLLLLKQHLECTIGAMKLQPNERTGGTER
jgi:hypothetical protein